MLAGKRIDSSGSCGGSDDERSHLRVRATDKSSIQYSLVFLDRVTNKVSNELKCLIMYMCWLNMSRELTGASMNPARTLGTAIATGTYTKIWIYIVAPPLGAIAGCGAYHALK